MRTLHKTTRFKKDLRLTVRRGSDIAKLKVVINLLTTEVVLPKKYHSHMLSGNYVGLWECHISPDWLLIYELFEDTVLLHRTGTHADLFK